MKNNFLPALQALLALGREGGYVNHHADPGGMTNLGVTAAVWAEWTGHIPSEKEMRGLTVEKVAPLYKRKYWDRVMGDSLPAGLDHAVFDFAVNSGCGRAVKVLQTVLGVSPDGALGPKTVQAISQKPLKTLIEDYNDARVAFLRGLSSYAIFKNGWERRVAEVNAEALNMA